MEFEGAAFKAEEQYARNHNDLAAKIYIGAGSDEIDEWFLAVSGITSGTAKFSETLRLRGYPSLALKSRIYDGEDHYSVAPRVIGDGIRYLWKEEAAKLGSSWPTRP